MKTLLIPLLLVSTLSLKTGTATVSAAGASPGSETGTATDFEKRWLSPFLLALIPQAADPEIVGTWFGSIDTDRGQMEIGLTVTLQKDKLAGVLKTGHGDWAVTGITEKDGQWIVAFKGGDNDGQLIGKIKDTKFAGEWKSKMANGTFELERSKKK